MNKKNSKNKYVTFITDEHLHNCIANLHKSYLNAKNNITKKDFYSNKVDTIKLTFDAKFNDISEESLIQSEILRQIDKSINNSIGTFHEQVLGGIDGFESGYLTGYDIKAKDNTLFALFVFEKLNPLIEESVFETFTKQAKVYKNAKFYLVDFNTDETYLEKWVTGNSEYKVSHKSVFKISCDQLYTLLSNQGNALNDLINTLPIALDDFFRLSLNT
jgi:translation elongation factor EF-G